MQNIFLSALILLVVFLLLNINTLLMQSSSKSLLNAKKIISFHEERARLARLEKEREEQIRRQRELRRSTRKLYKVKNEENMVRTSFSSFDQTDNRQTMSKPVITKFNPPKVSGLVLEKVHNYESFIKKSPVTSTSPVNNGISKYKSQIKIIEQTDKPNILQKRQTVAITKPTEEKAQQELKNEVLQLREQVQEYCSMIALLQQQCTQLKLDKEEREKTLLEELQNKKLEIQDKIEYIQFMEEKWENFLRVEKEKSKKIIDDLSRKNKQLEYQLDDAMKKILHLQKSQHDNSTEKAFKKKLAEIVQCPITLDIFVDPVVAPDGFTYEKSALLGWFTTEKDTSPMTRQKMNSTMIPNSIVKQIITEFLISDDQNDEINL